MAETGNPPQLGASDPELKSSPIVEEMDDDFERLGQQMDDVYGDTPACYFNNETYPEGTFICSGSELLRCERGAWVREGSCDTENQ